MTRPLASLLLSLVLAAAGAAAPLAGQESRPDAWLLMANPAEDMASGITIGWHARVPGTVVEVVPEADSDTTWDGGRRIPGVCEPVVHLDTATGVAHEVLNCRADVAGLEPGRAYRYRAGRDSFSHPGRFLTATPRQTFSFLYLSDIHVHNPLPGRLEAGVALLERARALEPGIRFTVVGGDLLAYGSAYDAWESLAASPLVSTQMTAATPGNHDFYDHTAQTRGPGYFNTFLHNPGNGADGVANTSYFFRYGNALFLSISSEDSWSSDALLEAQQAWFRRVVASHPATFIIVWTHRPFYNGSTGNAGHAQTNRANWSSLFDEFGVDLVLSGHDHVYVRTAPTAAGQAVRGPGRGTVYITSTAVGDRHRDADPANPYVNLERILGGQTLGTIVTLSSDAIRLRTIDLSGAVVDEAVLPARGQQQATSAAGRSGDHALAGHFLRVYSQSTDSRLSDRLARETMQPGVLRCEAAWVPGGFWYSSAGQRIYQNYTPGAAINRLVINADGGFPDRVHLVARELLVEAGQRHADLAQQFEEARFRLGAREDRPAVLLQQTSHLR